MKPLFSVWWLLVLGLGIMLAHPVFSQQDPLRLQLAAAPGPHRVGTPLDLSYRLSNASHHKLLVADPTLIPRPTVGPENWGVMLRVTTPDGLVVWLRRLDLYQAWCPVKRQSFRALKAGGVLGGRIVLGNEPVDQTQWAVYVPGSSSVSEREWHLLDHLFSQAGQYKIQAIYRNRETQVMEAGPQGASLVSVEAWTGEVRSEELTVEWR